MKLKKQLNNILSEHRYASFMELLLSSFEAVNYLKKFDKNIKLKDNLIFLPINSSYLTNKTKIYEDLNLVDSLFVSSLDVMTLRQHLFDHYSENKIPHFSLLNNEAKIFIDKIKNNSADIFLYTEFDEHYIGIYTLEYLATLKALRETETPDIATLLIMVNQNKALLKDNQKRTSVLNWLNQNLKIENLHRATTILVKDREGKINSDKNNELNFNFFPINDVKFKL